MSESKFLMYYNDIKRPGAKELLDFIRSTDFFTAPASTRYHGNYSGGLVDHSVNVYEQLEDRVATPETAAIVALLHDLCKADFYKIDFRNVKQPNGVWTKVPYYAIEDQRPIGNHGDKSVFLIQRYMKLTDEEIAAIRYHMGGFQEGDTRNVSAVFEKYPLAVALHIADMEATYYKDKKLEVL